MHNVDQKTIVKSMFLKLVFTSYMMTRINKLNIQNILQITIKSSK